jgi:hypothetical protein
MHAVAVAAAVRSAHQASGHIPRAVIVAPGVGLEFVAADAAGLTTASRRSQLSLV